MGLAFGVGGGGLNQIFQNNKKKVVLFEQQGKVPKLKPKTTNEFAFLMQAKLIGKKTENTLQTNYTRHNQPWKEGRHHC